MNRTQKAKCREIAEKYGMRSQEQQSVSELAELLEVLTRRQNQRGNDWRNKLIDEIADVRIMLEQLQTLHAIDSETISEQIDYKLNRQLGRIEKGE